MTSKRYKKLKKVNTFTFTMLKQRSGNNMEIPKSFLGYKNSDWKKNAVAFKRLNEITRK